MKLPRIILADDHAMLIQAFRKLSQPHCEMSDNPTYQALPQNRGTFGLSTLENSASRYRVVQQT
jgi:hypothetical protein